MKFNYARAASTHDDVSDNVVERLFCRRHQLSRPSQSLDRCQPGICPQHILVTAVIPTTAWSLTMR